ncbi:arrestin domain-containing protein 2 [Drosophila grimshawi]|uniref:GH19257 n=1 Tax=Drosophila grimshawi TaxID=7222 RepID=B4JF69_DROGR|nr:arrestin domain-containing protein 2 [Drosophila grimshawi]EDV93350.1 GH19257 [Drosophila grimshawi]
MGVTCIIEFDGNSHGTFFAGQVMTGKVTLKLDKAKVIKALSLNIRGFAETEWSESRGTGKDRSKDYYRGREDYIASKTYLAGSTQSTQISIEAGVHVYNFTCQIPAICPSSFEGFYGRVRYMVTVAMERPWKFDQTYVRCFTVLKMMDLNMESPLFRLAAHVETQKSYCCWPCSSAPLQLQLSLPQTGFVSGQAIPVNMTVTNDSHIRIEMLQVSLAMVVTYFAEHFSRRHSRTERFVVTKLMGDHVPNYCKKQFTYLLRVPATPPTCNNLCKIIQIAYKVEVEAKVKGCHRNQMISIPVTIGNVPLSEHLYIQQRGMEIQTPQTLDAKALSDSAAAAFIPPPIDSNMPWTMDSSIPPPNYEEAVHMRHNPDSVNGIKPTAPPNTQSLDENEFAPLYPIFNIPSPTAPMASTDNDGFPNADAVANKGTWL